MTSQSAPADRKIDVARLTPRSFAHLMETSYSGTV